jgi:hypothetical protein
MVQITPCDYWLIAEHEGDYWCKDSGGVQSNTYYRTEKGSPVPEQLVDTVAYLLNLTFFTPINESDWWEEGSSNEQEWMFGKVVTDGAGVTHCGALNLTGNTMLLIEYNITCPAQREKDEYGVERYWPAINMGRYGRTQTHIHFCLFCSMVLIAMGDFNRLLWYK